ncbi:O-antigen ligase family protein [Bacteroides fragilis]|nr:O-antigen ligase family protein [Bacteroides fragilis]
MKNKEGYIQFSFIDKVIFFLSTYLLLFDCVNGYFLENGIDIPVSLLIKNILLILILYRLSYDVSFFKIAYFICLYVAILLSYYTFFDDIQYIYIGKSFTHLMKFLVTIVYFHYFSNSFQLLSSESILCRIKSIIYFSFIVIFINIILGPFGFGYKQYGGTFTYRGFFYAGNDLSGVVLLLIPLILFFSLLNRKKVTWQYVLLCFISLLVGVLIGTKTGLISIFMSFLIVPKLYNRQKIGWKRKLVKAILSCILVLIVIYVIYYLLDYTGSLQRWSYMLEKEDLSAVIYSGRDYFWDLHKKVFYKSPFEVLLLGMGGGITVERDFHDTLLNYGIIGVIIVYSFYAYVLIRSFIYYNKSEYPFAKIFFFINVLLLSASCISGHIIYSGTTNFFIAVVNSLQYYKEKEINEKNHCNI